MKVYSPWRDNDDADFSPKDIAYDEIVDDSDFKKAMSENEVSSQIQSFGASGQEGVYDLDEYGKGREPSFAMVELRSGKLDKADVSQIQKVLEVEAKQSADADEKEALRAQQQELSQRRQEAIDKQLGISDQSNSYN